MPTKGNRAIGSLDFSDSERRKLAAKSRTWRCETCGLIKDLLKHPEDANRASVCPSGSEPGPSTRVEANSTDDQDNRKDRLSDRSDSDGEDRDSSSDSQLTNNSGNSGSDSESNHGSSSNGETTEAKSTTTTRQQAYSRLSQKNSHSSTSNRRDSSPPTRGSTIADPVHNLSAMANNDVRPAYTSFVFRSIFVLLSLLILRRVVMVIQA